MMKLVVRQREISKIEGLLRRHRVVSILGPRQCGKTTLARAVFEQTRGPKTYFDLESPRDATRLEDPLLVLEGLRGLVVLDEIQRAPKLYEVLRVLVDRPRPAKFLILGSAAPELVRGVSESLAGRVVFHELGGLTLGDVGVEALDRLWERGAFPRSLLARSLEESVEWRDAFVRTFLERDVPSLGLGLPPASVRRLWTMLAHYHGQVWNGSELGSSLGISHHTARRHLDLLVGTYMVRNLEPFLTNVGKRLVKAPKIYLRDSGLLHTLLSLSSLDALLDHPKVGASWEGFAMEQVIAALAAQPREIFFWATHAGAELDLLIVRGRSRRGFEFKRASAPTATKSMHVAVADLDLEHLDVIYPGTETYPLTRKIRAVPLARLIAELS
jgi:predicted AAA+ superfamily ATPase